MAFSTTQPTEQYDELRSQVPWKIIEPKFWTGVAPVSPSAYEIDCTGCDMSSPATAPHVALEMERLYKKTGLVLLSNTGLTDLSAMREWTKVIIKKPFDYTGGANSRDVIEPNVYDVGAPRQAWLQYHHEMAYVGHSVRNIAFCCKSALSHGRGSTFVSDGVKATNAILKTEFGQKLKEKGVCYVRKLTDRDAYKDAMKLQDNLNNEEGVYNHWQHSFATDDPMEAQRKAEEKGLVVEWGPDPLGHGRCMLTKYYASAFEYFAPMGRSLLYSSVADDDMWFDSWPGMMHLPPACRPLKLLFGDETEMTDAERQAFVDVYDAFGMPIRWKPGDIAIMCNYRWAHGRPGYEMHEGEKRELGVVLGEPYARVGDHAHLHSRL
eukprot:TRINITY_DN3866_c0_g2_i1.p1 TRINITY_DN3866_c0_g2~~TRINITY_DN3866_c0_g2_i1.p1  ORF type:complete len:391 (-),score=45.77 TRINITY_DN3866_c0_g2_i1:570-1706(-)